MSEGVKWFVVGGHLIGGGLATGGAGGNPAGGALSGGLMVGRIGTGHYAPGTYQAKASSGSLTPLSAGDAPGSCQTHVCLAQSAGGIDDGTTGGPGSGSTEFPAQADEAIADGIMMAAPLPTPGKLTAGARLLNWLRKTPLAKAVIEGIGKRLAARGAPRVLEGTSKQFGKKFGQHRLPERPGYRTPAEYRGRANEIFNHPGATRTTIPKDAAKYPGETHVQLGDELLRLDPDGNFRSLYVIQ